MIKVYIGGYSAPTYRYRLIDGQAWYGYSKNDRCILKPIREPSSEKIKTFWDAIDELGVWGWEGTYVDVGISNGGQFEVKLLHGNHALVCNGSNKYPLKWNEFRKALSELIELNI